MTGPERFLASLTTAEQAVLVEIILRAFVRNDPARVTAMLEVLVDGASIKEAARANNISRWTLKRQIKAFRETVRAVASPHDVASARDDHRGDRPA